MTLLKKVIASLLLKYNTDDLNYIFSNQVPEVLELINEPYKQQQSRYRDYPGKAQEPFPNYNINTLFTDYPWLMIGEGPANANDWLRLKMNTQFNPGLGSINNPFSYLAIGQAEEQKKSKYYPYASYVDLKNHENIKANIEINPLDPESWKDQAIHLQIPAWNDMETCTFSQAEIQFLFAWFGDNSIRKFIHCSAGLGRSGTLLLAWGLANLPENPLLNTKNTPEEEMALAEQIAECLIQARRIRPGLIMTDKQLDMAISLGQSFSQLKQEALLNQELSNTSSSSSSSSSMPITCSRVNTSFSLLNALHHARVTSEGKEELELAPEAPESTEDSSPRF